MQEVRDTENRRVKASSSNVKTDVTKSAMVRPLLHEDKSQSIPEQLSLHKSLTSDRISRQSELHSDKEVAM